VAAVLRIDQLRGNAHPVAGLAYRALEDVPHVELPRHRRDVDVLALERKRRGARDDLEPPNLGQQAQQFLRNAIGKILLFGVGAHVLERQHRDRELLGPARPPLVPGKQDQPGRQDGDDDEVHAPAGRACDRLAFGNIFLEAQALGRDLEKPGEDQGDGKANGQQDQDPLAGAFGQRAEADQDLGHLHHQPGRHHVQHRHAEHVAALEFRKQLHRRWVFQAVNKTSLCLYCPSSAKRSEPGGQPQVIAPPEDVI
jgi:hypothetical protein